MFPADLYVEKVGARGKLVPAHTGLSVGQAPKYVGLVVIAIDFKNKVSPTVEYLYGIVGRSGDALRRVPSGHSGSCGPFRP